MRRQYTVSRVWLWMIPCLLLAFWLGSRGLDAEAASLDERFALELLLVDWLVDNSLRPLDNLWQRVAEREPGHPPCYYLTLTLYSRWMGVTVPALRTLSLFIGVLAVAGVYWLGR